jgi:hypothetical protein
MLWATRNTGLKRRRGLPAIRKHRFDQRGNVVRRSVRQDPVTQVEHVPRRRTRGAQDGGRFAPHRIRIREEDQRIEVALQRDPAADASSSVGQVHGPVEPDRGGAGRGKLVEPCAAAW